MIVRLALALSLATLSATQADVYVVPDDVVDLHDALGLAGPGDEIVLRAGVHYGPVYVREGGITLRGEPGAWIDSSTAQPAIQLSFFIRDPVIIRDLELNPWRAIISEVDEGFVEIRNCTFRGDDRLGEPIVITGSAPHLIEGCRFEDSGQGASPAIFTLAPTIIRDCEFDEVGPLGAIGASCPSLVVEGSAFRRTGTAIEVASPRVEIRDNVFEEAGDTPGLICVPVAGHESIVIERNVFAGHTGPVILGAGVVRSNTIVAGAATATAVDALLPSVTVPIDVSANIIVGAGTAVDARHASILEPVSMACNLVWNVDQVGAGSVENTDGVAGDPLFCDADAGDYDLRDDSLAADWCGQTLGAGDVGCSVVPVQAVSWGSVKARYR